MDKGEKEAQKREFGPPSTDPRKMNTSDLIIEMVYISRGLSSQTAYFSGRYEGVDDDYRKRLSAVKEVIDKRIPIS